MEGDRALGTLGRRGEGSGVACEDGKDGEFHTDYYEEYWMIMF